MAEGTDTLDGRFVLDWVTEDDGSLVLRIVPIDPGAAQFWVTIPATGEPGYTRYLPAHEKAVPVAETLIKSGLLPADYLDRVHADADAAAEAVKAQRIAELESELRQLQE